MSGSKRIVTVISRISDAQVFAPTLVVMYGPNLGEIYAIEGPSIVIGRSSKADIQVDQESVSRNHVKLARSGDNVELRDLGSTNGTYVNDELVDEYTLRDGDLIKVGRCIFKFLARNSIELAYHQESRRQFEAEKAERRRLEQERVATSTNSPEPVDSGEITQVNSWRSVFVAYGQPDAGFAEKLYHALLERGMKVWFFPKSARFGEKIHRQATYNINEYDRVAAICSRASLHRKGFLNELETVCAREAREGGESRLIPIRLDDAVFTDDWAPEGRKDLKVAVTDRVVGDFTRWQDEVLFLEALRRLIAELRKDT